MAAASSRTLSGKGDIELVDAEKDFSVQVDWTAEEESRAKMKLDLILLPLLTLGFFCLQLDRGNIANAITDTFMEDVGITQFQFNVGQQLLSLGIVIFEIPSNMILYKVGPGKWLTLQLFLFGLVSTFQAWQRNYSSYLATRFLLGVTESGYIPGGLWTLSTWYTRQETAKRTMIFFFGNQLGQASAKLIAYGILHMKGVAGYPGWFWLFVLMGGFTIASGITMGLFLPDSIENPRSLFLPKVRFFTDRELHILRDRVRLDDSSKSNRKQHIGLDAFKRASTNWRIWVHVLITFFNNGPFRGFDTYGPTIIRSFGFLSLTSNALASVGLFLQVPMSYTLSYISDRFDKRGETVMFGITMHLFGYILNGIFTEVDNRGVRYFGVVWTQTFANLPHPLNIAWMSLACRDPEERSLAMAMIIMSANVAAIYGAQLFQADDKPRYRRAFGLNSGLLAMALVLAALRYGYDQVKRKRITRTTLARLRPENSE
ncbi:major facilitator superfamily domain-containing protein [Paraphoma chrysanthemicola]|uniref:Major facilitator superfamily domain-containing protein n=1 Tax=Paraphoma chrysanthemicola TaxID=798071 RepID=A0A8K0RBS8_9PLEO|nr:major facilitator superfamily domain-containing protein [Paraphoma chrysanthemicola]